MLLDQAFSLKESPRALFWIAILLISFFGMFYLGLNPSLIDEWYLVLIGFNVITSCIVLDCDYINLFFWNVLSRSQSKFDR